MPKTWLITGAARGLGRSIVEAALASGAQVLATARQIGGLADLSARYGEKFKTFVLDVTDPEGAHAAVADTVKAFGGVDVLVNNAGYGLIRPFEQIDETDFRTEFETNFFGVVNMVRAALPGMRSRRSGTIVNISSVGGRTGEAGLSAYQSAKFAVGGFSEVLAKEVAPFGVKVLCVEPGGMRTNWGFTALSPEQPMLPEYEPSVGILLGQLKQYAGQEIGDPAKIGRLLVELAEREKLPVHLLLGSDALFVYGQAEAAMAREAEAWKSVSTSTDFEGVDISFLARPES